MYKDFAGKVEQAIVQRRQHARLIVCSNKKINHFYAVKVTWTICSVMQASFVESQKGGQKLLLQGHLFLKVRENQGTTYWRCASYFRTKCRATATTEMTEAKKVKKYLLCDIYCYFHFCVRLQIYLLSYLIIIFYLLYSFIIKTHFTCYYQCHINDKTYYMNTCFFTNC